MSDTGTVELSSRLLSQLETRANGANFEDVDSYVEFVLEEVVHQLGEPESSVDEDTVRDRLESLGYVE